jgi:hypothetical protein
VDDDDATTKKKGRRAEVSTKVEKDSGVGCAYSATTPWAASPGSYNVVKPVSWMRTSVSLFMAGT